MRCQDWPGHSMAITGNRIQATLVGDRNWDRSRGKTGAGAEAWLEVELEVELKLGLELDLSLSWSSGAEA